MTKMSEAQRRAILDAHVRQLDRIGTGTVSANPGTVKVLRREDWVSTAFATFDKPTPAGLRAAGFDFDLLHGQALAEHCNRLGILDEPDSPRGRTFAQAVYSSTDGTYASALDLLHEEALKLNASSQTGISDRVAAALQELSDLRAMIRTGVVQSHDARSELRERVARAEQLLRAEGGQ